MLACVNPTGEVGRNIVRDEFNECKDNPHRRPALHVPNCGENATGRMPTSGGTRKSGVVLTEKYVQVDSKMIVEEDTDLIVHDPQTNCTTKYVFIEPE